MKKIILILLLASPLSSACDYMNLGFVSYHFDRSQEFNEKNYGIGCENIMESGLDVIVFKNSHDDIAGGASFFLPMYESKHFNFGGQVGVMLGYDVSKLFLISPRAELVFGRVGFDLFAMPGGIALGFKVKL